MSYDPYHVPPLPSVVSRRRRYIYYFENDNPLIQVRYLSGLIALINEQMAAEGGGQSQFSSAVEAHYRNTLGMK